MDFLTGLVMGYLYQDYSIEQRARGVGFWRSLFALIGYTIWYLFLIVAVMMLGAFVLMLIVLSIEAVL